MEEMRLGVLQVPETRTGKPGERNFGRPLSKRGPLQTGMLRSYLFREECPVYPGGSST